MPKLRHSISAREVAVLGIVLLLLLLMAAFFHPLISLGSKRRVNPEKVKDLAPLAELSVRSINLSSDLAYESLWSDVKDSEILEVEAKSELTFSSLMEVEDVVKETVGGSLRERLLNATYCYENVSSASINASEAAYLLDQARPSLMLALDLLLKGNVSEALAIWNGIESKVLESRKLVGDAISSLIEVDRSSLLSEAHEQVVNGSQSKLEQLADELDQIISLFLLVKERPQEVEKILEAALSLESGAYIDLKELLEEEGVKAAIQASENLNPGKAGRFAYHVGRFKALMQFPCACQQAGQQGDVGSGAGREERPDD
ncbi:MAG: hypothetical protein DRO05_00005 [Thermoproteota archaeon]|nr:MAG: hypothetical protein DRO05_00005 [Candidatus Korarchaeota archaeon]